MSAQEAIDQLKKGEFVIVTDDESRENEADLVLAAQFMTPDKLNFLLTHARGMICVPMLKNRLDELNLPLMVPKESNEEYTSCAFTVSCDAREGIGTGISAADRSRTIQLLADPRSTSQDFVRPGHVFPLQAAKGGLQERQGHTEAALRLCELAELEPVAVICEILDAKGNAYSAADIKKNDIFSSYQVVSIEDISRL